MPNSILSQDRGGQELFDVISAISAFPVRCSRVRYERDGKQLLCLLIDRDVEIILYFFSIKDSGNARIIEPVSLMSGRFFMEQVK